MASLPGMPALLAVPNVSEGGDPEVLAAIGEALGHAATVLDRHTDADHDRTVFTLAGRPGELTRSLAAGAEEALETIDMSTYRGAHPAIGALAAFKDRKSTRLNSSHWS